MPMVKVILTRRKDVLDGVLSAFEAARMQLHLRAARENPQLKVVHYIEPISPDELDYEAKVEAERNTDRVSVTGDHAHVASWIAGLVDIEAAFHTYEVELPPEAREEEPNEDAWSEFLNDRIDSPYVYFTARICRDADEWAVGLG